MRIFIAIELPAEIKQNLIKIQSSFLDIKARWVKPEHMHLTLVFLGEIEEKKLIEIEQVCHQAAKNFNKFNIEFSGLGAFPNFGQPHTLWVGIKKSPVLQNLQQQISAGLIQKGFKIEKRPFQPHLTLARLKKQQDLTAIISKFKQPEFGKFQVSEFNIFASQLFSEGPKHQMIKKFNI